MDGLEVNTLSQILMSDNSSQNSSLTLVSFGTRHKEIFEL